MDYTSDGRLKHRCPNHLRRKPKLQRLFVFPMPSEAQAKADEVTATVDSLRDTFANGKTLPLAWRRKQLQQLRLMINENKELWFSAVQQAFNKPLQEIELSETLLVELELNQALSNLERWTALEHYPTPLALIPASSWVEPQPLGVTLIIGPCNYPLLLLAGPLVGALAAGCPVVLKPSEHCSKVEQAFVSLVPRYLDPEAVKVVPGGADTVTALLDQQWDNIIFTGSMRVGKIVAAAAARHLTPVTLELGGKCPVVVGPEPGDLAWVAKKLVFGRCFNGGQSCVAPEFVLVPRELCDGLCRALVKEIRDSYGPEPKESPYLARLINSAAAARVQSMLGEKHGGEVLCGGAVDVPERYVAPTVVLGPSLGSKLMQEETFAPVLSVLPVDSLDEAIRIAAVHGPKPLALYVFTGDRAVADRVLARLPSGTASVNDVAVQFCNSFLPFGGIGTSGLGRQHGKAFFDACVSKRAVMSKGTSLPSRLLDLQALLRGAPYAPWKLSLVKLVVHPIFPALPARYGYKAALGCLFVPALAALVCEWPRVQLWLQGAMSWARAA